MLSSLLERCWGVVAGCWLAKKRFWFYLWGGKKRSFDLFLGWQRNLFGFIFGVAKKEVLVGLRNFFGFIFGVAKKRGLFFFLAGKETVSVAKKRFWSVLGRSFTQKEIKSQQDKDRTHI